LVAPALVTDPAVEVAFLAMSVVLAGAALHLGIRRHGNPAPVLPVGVGLLAWGASLTSVLHPIPEELSTFLAALTVAGGLLWNARLQCIRVEPCGSTCPDCAAVASGTETPP